MLRILEKARLGGLAAALALLAPASAFAQAYVVNETSEAYAPLAADSGTTLVEEGDAESIPVALPFRFRFFGRDYTQVWVSVNGVVTFLGEDPVSHLPLPPGDGNLPMPATAKPQALLAPFWDDWVASALAPAGGSRIAWAVEGSEEAHDRVFVVDWQRLQRFGAVGASAPAYSFQLRLHEATGKYELRFGPRVGSGDAVLDATSGAENHLGTVGVSHKACSPTCAAADLVGAPSLLVSPNLDPELSIGLTLVGAAQGGPLVDVYVQNNGLTEADAVTFDLYLSKDRVLSPDDVKVYSLPTPVDLGAQPADFLRQVAVPLPPGTLGAYFLIGLVDPDDTVPELDQSNNVAALVQPFIAGPELSIDAVGQSAADIGSTASYNASITNSGVADARGARLKVWLSGGQLPGARALLTSEPFDVRALSSERRSFAVTVPEGLFPGAYTVDMEIDSERTVTEADETNNRMREPIELTLRGPEVGVVSLAAGLPTAYQGLALPVQLELQNTGTSAARDFTYSIHLSTNDHISITDPRLYTSAPVTLEAHESLPLSHAVTIPATTAPGTYYLGVIVDAARKINEYDTSNNVLAAPDQLVVSEARPDLVVASVASQPSVQAGARARVGAVLANVGTRGATFDYGLFLTDNGVLSPADVRLGEGRLTLAPGAQQAIALDVEIPPTLRAGTYQIGLIADPAALVVDADRANNQALAGALQVLEPALTVLTTALPEALVDTQYDVQLAVRGGAAPATWKLAGGALPPGISLASSGRLSGTPTTAGVFAVVVEAASAELRAVRTLTLSVRRFAASLGLLDARLPAARRGVLYTAQLGASGGTGSHTFRQSGGELPPGLTLEPSGKVSGFPIAIGEFSVQVTVEDEAGQTARGSVALPVYAEGALTLLAPRLRDAEVGRAYSASLPIEGGKAPYAVAVRDGTLPEGLSAAVDASGTAVAITGTARVPGVSAFALVVSDSRGERALEHLTLSVARRQLTFITSALPQAPAGATYSALIEANAREPFTFALAGGELPPGLTLDASGAIAGAVQRDAVPRAYAFAVEVTDGQGGYAVAPFAIDVPSPTVARPASSGCASTGADTGLLALLALGALALRRRRALPAALAAALTVGLALPAAAQYRIVREEAPFVPFAPETRTVALDTLGGGYGTVLTRGQAVPLPFAFKFFGVQQTLVGLTSKGLLSFGTVSLSWARDELMPIPGAGGPSMFVAPMWGWMNLYHDTPNGPSLVSWRVEGEAPHRVFAVEYLNMQPQASDYRGPSYAAYSYQVRLYETTNELAIHYDGDGPLSGRTPPMTFAMGVEGSDGTEGYDLSDAHCSPFCTGANFPRDQVIRLQLVPDLSIESVEAPAVLVDGVEATVRAVVRNTGGADASRTRIRYVLSKDTFVDASDVVLADSPATTVVAEAAASIATRVTVPAGTAPGLYNLLARVDPDGLVVELDERNNAFRPLPVSVSQPAPDFSPVRLIGPNAVDAGATASVTRTLKNGGNAAGSGRFLVVLSANALVSTADLVLDSGSFSLPAGGVLDATVNVTIPAGVTPGQYHLGLLVRPDEGVAEINPLDNDRVFGPFTIRGAQLAVTSEQLPTVAAGVPFSTQLVAQGGAGDYRWSVGAPALPQGVSLSQGGVLSGLVDTTGEWPLQVVVESHGARASRTYTLRATGVATPLSVVSRRLPLALLGAPYSGNLLAQGGQPPYRWSTAGTSALPSGLGLAADGTIEGVPLADGLSPVQVQVTDAAGHSAEAEVVLPIAGPQLPLFAGGELPKAQLGAAYSARLRMAGGTAPYRVSVVDTRKVPVGPLDDGRTLVGEMPGGLRLSEAGEISGTPSTPGVYVLTVRLVDALANDDSASFVLTVESGTALQIRTASLPDAILGQPYAVQLQADGAQGELSWEAVLVEGAALPPGLTLRSNGILQGKALAVGHAGFFAVARDATGRFASKPLAVRVVEPAPVAEESGCSQSGGSWMAALVLAGLLALRRRGASLALVAIVAGGLALGGCSAKPQSACTETCGAGLTCDERDGLCKCGGEGGALCLAGETCQPETRSCVVPTCESGCKAPFVCGADSLCHCGSASGPTCAEGESCNAFGRCERTSRCAGVVCGAGLACNEATGACVCGPNGPACGAGERCVDAACVPDRCVGVACSGGTACDPADGLCKCGGPGGAVCAGGEACQAEQARCVRSSRCDGVSCELGSSCDPADGLCKCGGPGGPRCGDDQSCDAVARRCVGGDMCAGVSCASGTSCDPEDGQCKCGGLGGALCASTQACVVKGAQARCEQRCDVLGSSCGTGRTCRYDPEADLTYCAATGSAQVGQTCGDTVCGADLHCVGASSTSSGVCRAYCLASNGCSSGFACALLQVNGEFGLCLPAGRP